LHELEVHQVELEIQNDKLKLAQRELETNLQRYTELFDFAPIGYATLGADGTVREINHAGASLIGRERGILAGRRFETFVADGDRKTFAGLLIGALGGDLSKCEMELLRPAQAPVWVRVTATGVARSEPTVLVAFVDVTEQRDHEEKLAAAERWLR